MCRSPFKSTGRTRAGTIRSILCTARQGLSCRPTLALQRNSVSLSAFLSTRPKGSASRFPQDSLHQLKAPRYLGVPFLAVLKGGPNSKPSNLKGFNLKKTRPLATSSAPFRPHFPRRATSGRRAFCWCSGRVMSFGPFALLI